jgi:hypothetical protein
MVRVGLMLVIVLWRWVPGYTQARSVSENVRNTSHSKRWNYIERIVPGITFQYPGRNHGGVDFNPFIGYQFTSKLTAGLGWNERLGFRFRHHFGISHRRGVYGPRSFVDYKLFKGFSVRGELETMNTFVPPLLGVSPPGAEGSRKWVLGVFVGVKKNFRITNSIQANLQVLYNFYDDVSKISPYGDRLNLRAGFEFSLHQKRTAILY